MKFIHLGDLHIGKRVNDFPMIKDQEYILDQIIDVMIKEKVNVCLIAGDVYDKAVPAAEAVTLFDEFLTRVASLDIKVYIISGNHDSAERLAFAKNLMGNSGVYIAPVFNGQVTKEVYEDEYGKVNIYMLPFIKPIQVKRFYINNSYENIVIKDKNVELIRNNKIEQNETDESQNNATFDTYNDAYKVVMDSVKIDITQRNIILAHQFVTGAKTCDSEELAIGGLDNISSAHFDDYDYVALGHIHSPQKIIKETVRYSGTPLKYSLSEMNHKKTVTIVDMKEKGNIQIEQIELMPLHDMRHIKGSYEEVTFKDNYIGTNTMDYMYITLTDEEDVPDAIGRLRSIYPNIMKLDYDNTRTRGNANVDVVEKIEEKSPIELFAQLYEMQNNQSMSLEQETYIKELIESVWEE